MNSMYLGWVATVDSSMPSGDKAKYGQTDPPLMMLEGVLNVMLALTVNSEGNLLTP